MVVVLSAVESTTCLMVDSMAKGVRATARQKAAGRKNLMKANVMRIGRRGMKYGPRKPKGVF